MKQRATRRIILIFVACLFLPAYAADRMNALRDDLDRVFSDKRLADAQLGVKIISLDHPEVVYEKNSSKLYMPASNNKIITVAVALVSLGPNYRFKTDILAEGRIVDGSLNGNLIVKGFGDPSSSSRIEPKDPFLAFRDWAARLKQQGIHKISGSILGDASVFENKVYGQGWAWDDLPEGYAAPISALQFNENLIWLEISPGLQPGSPASIKTEPLQNYLTIESYVVTDAASKTAPIDVIRNGPEETVDVRGTIPLGNPKVSRAVAVKHPVRYYLSALRQLLGEEGIDVSGCGTGDVENSDDESIHLLWTHTSMQLAELVAPVMKQSLNLSAETLVRVLGLELRGEASFAKGKEVVEETLGQMGIPKDSYSYVDGSGLSRQNFISADSLVRVLQFMYRQPSFRAYYDALSVAGVDGTLAARMKKTKAENNVHAKTGTFANASALTGYLQTADGEMLAFSILANNFVGSKDAAENVQNKALARLAGFSRKEKPPEVEDHTR